MYTISSRRLVTELESFKPGTTKPGEKKDKKATGDSAVTYQLFYRPEQAKFSNNARVLYHFWSFVFERPILGDHTKAHISRFLWNPAYFMWNPPANLINQIFQQKHFSFMEYSGKAMSQDFVKSAGFREMWQISWNPQRKTNCQEW